MKRRHSNRISVPISMVRQMSRQGSHTQPPVVTPPAESDFSLSVNIENNNDGFTFLVPLKSNYYNLDANTIRVKDSTNALVPVEVRRVSSKYLHVDIDTDAAGTYTVFSNSANYNISEVFDIQTTSTYIKVSNGKVDIKFNKSGALVESFKIDNIEKLSSPINFKISNPNNTLSISECVIDFTNKIFCRIKQRATLGNVEFLFYWTISRNRSFVKCDTVITNGGLGGWLNGTQQHFSFDKLYFEFDGTDALTSEKVSVNGTTNDQKIIDEVSSDSIGTNNFSIAYSGFYQHFPAKLTATSNNYKLYLIDGTSQQLEGKKQKRFRTFIGKNINNAANYFHNPSYTINNDYMLEFLGMNASNRSVESLLGSGFANVTTPQRGIDRLIGCGYDVNAAQTFNAYTAKSFKEWRETSIQYNFGWKNYGDIMWDNGLSGQYCNLHYDMPAILIKEWLRTNAPRAYRIGIESAEYRGTCGQVHGDEFFQNNPQDNLNGLALYEKNDHNGNSVVQPSQSHNWIEGLWLHYLITGDYLAHQNATAAAARMLAFNDYNIGFAIGSNNGRFLGWTVYALVNSYLYTEDQSYITKALELTDEFIDTEIALGSKGYFLYGISNISEENAQIFSYAGYTLIGFAMLHRITGQVKLRDFLVRAANWLIGTNHPTNPPLVGGDTNGSGQYRNLGARYFWRADNTYAADDYPNIAYSFEAMPLLVEAYRITNNIVFKNKAKTLYKDLAYYRDYAFEGTADGYHDPAGRALINLNSLVYAGSAAKVYAQTALFAQAVQSFMKDETF